MEYLGQPTSADYIAPLAGEVMAFCRTKSGWTTHNRQAPDFYDRDRDLIRDVAYPPHLATARASAGDEATIFRMVNAATDNISPPHMKQRQIAALQALGFDGQLTLIEKEHLDGKVFKQLVHGLEQFPSVVTRGGIPKASRVRFTVRAGEEAGGYGQTSFG